MRTIVRIIIAGVFALILAGCSSLPSSPPQRTLPIKVADVVFAASRAEKAPLVRRQVDLRTVNEWAAYRNHPELLEGVGVSLQATNVTGEPASLRIYASKSDRLMAETINEAVLLLKADLVDDAGATRYDFGMLPLLADARKILSTGHFYLYILGVPDAMIVHTSDMELRVSVDRK